MSAYDRLRPGLNGKYHSYSAYNIASKNYQNTRNTVNGHSKNSSVSSTHSRRTRKDNGSMASVISSISQLSEDGDELTEHYTELKHIRESFDQNEDDDRSVVVNQSPVHSPRSHTSRSSRRSSRDYTLRRSPRDRRSDRRLKGKVDFDHQSHDEEADPNPLIPVMSPAISETEELEEIPPNKLKNGRALSNDILNFFAM